MKMLALRSLAAAMLVAFAGSTSYAQLSLGDLIITEFFANPSTGGPFGDDGEFFEVYNTTNATINLNGLTFVEDDGNNEQFTVVVDAFVAPGDFFVIGGIAPVGDGGDLTLESIVDLNFEDGSSVVFDGASTFFAIGNGADEIEIFDGATEIFSLTYGNGDPFGSDVSAELIDFSLAADGVVTEDDYIASTTPLGLIDDAFASPGTAGNTVPEPSTGVLLLMAASLAGAASMRSRLG